MVQVGDEWFKVFNSSDVEAVSWEEAHAICSAMNMKLAEPQDPEALLNHLTDTYTSWQWWWYGAKAEGVSTFYWDSTGEEINYTNDDFTSGYKLGPGENCDPTENQNGKCCLTSGTKWFSRGNGLLGAIPCSDIRPYICQCQ